MNLFEQDNLIYIPPKQPLLNPQTSEGLEILGTFCRRLSKIQLELKLINRNNVNLTDFAIQLNKNSFGLNLDQNSGSLFPQYLSPYQSVDITFDLNLTDLQGPSEPINSVQLAFRTNLGVFFTQATFSLHILFNEEGMLDQSDFLNLWPQYGAIGEYTIQIDNINNIGTVKLLREKLHKNNVFTIADRFIDNKHYLFLSLKLDNGNLFLLELGFYQLPVQQCTLTIKPTNSNLIYTILEAVGNILKS